VSKTWRLLKKPSKHQAITTCCDLTGFFLTRFLDANRKTTSLENAYLKLPQKRWMRLQASSRSEVLVA
jgi:hypothetical protein